MTALPGLPRPPGAPRRRALLPAAALALLAAGPAPAADPPAPATPAPLPALRAGEALDPGWRLVALPGDPPKAPATAFEPGAADGVAGVRVRVAGSYGNLVHAVDATAAQRLQWRWRLDEPLAGGQTPADILERRGDDAALKVCVLFDHALDRVPFVERQVLRVARRVSGEPLPAATVCYLWDSTYPAELSAANPYTRRVRFISLRGREAPLARWVDESRDVAQDLRRLFADELPADAPLPRITQVLVGGDGDNTGARASGWIAQIRWAPTAP